MRAAWTRSWCRRISGSSRRRCVVESVAEVGDERRWPPVSIDGFDGRVGGADEVAGGGPVVVEQARVEGDAVAQRDDSFDHRLHGGEEHSAGVGVAVLMVSEEGGDDGVLVE